MGAIIYLAIEKYKLKLMKTNLLNRALFMLLNFHCQRTSSEHRTLHLKVNLLSKDEPDRYSK